MPKSATLTVGKPKPRGAPSKKIPAAIERGLAVAKEGLPLRFVAGAIGRGVTFETLNQWRKDPEFAQALENARTEGVLLKVAADLNLGRQTNQSFASVLLASSWIGLSHPHHINSTNARYHVNMAKPSRVRHIEDNSCYTPARSPQFDDAMGS